MVYRLNVFAKNPSYGIIGTPRVKLILNYHYMQRERGPKQVLSSNYSEQSRGVEPMARDTAADILREVARVGEFGGDMTPRPHAIGRALFRILSNNGAPDEYNLAELTRGFLHQPSELLVEDPPSHDGEEDDDDD
ncbi:MAG TPA: hypothetical protein DCY48_02125 [Candidatus Magasanikbacteria bacterium]|nr:MAG: hypothetical protein A3C10_02190 [Candidatus Magasanikbacteria bacterium RIFCSPHIGHO2_02_FULL_48_18]OGH82983.1 MAG: hypothetical protein A3G08_03675 [Candidatus Magasanikbacteria bacterium RIFCSPLOWO2_12_FULL_47_9b]HAZ28553.1 hypothetical protein [Candidatus Magasanikbacteria bacterium]